MFTFETSLSQVRENSTPVGARFIQRSVGFIGVYIILIIFEKTRNVTVCNKCPRRPLIMTLVPGCDPEHSQGPESCTGHKLSFCFTFLCDPGLRQRTLILIMTHHLIIVYRFIKSN